MMLAINTIKPPAVNYKNKHYNHYCKWSDDNYGCDLCCYQELTGEIVILVSSTRFKAKPPAIPSIEREKSDDFIQAYNAYNDYMERAERVTIGLKHDGKTFRCDSERALVRQLKRLKEVGYRFPVNLISNLENK